MTDNNTNNKRIAKNTLLLYFRMGLTMLVSLYTSRIVLETLGVEDYGIYNVVGGVVAIFSFLNGAMAVGTQRFLTFELGRKDYQTLKETFSMSFQIHVGIALIVFVLAETIGLWFLNTQMDIPIQRVVAANWVYQFSVLSAIMSLTQVPYTGVILAHEKMTIYAYVGMIEVFFKLIIVYLLTLFTFDKLKLFSFLIFITSVATLSTYRYYCISRFDEAKYCLTKNSTILKSLINFAGWSLFGSVAYLGKEQGINILLNILFGATLNATWGISTQVKTAINSFVQNFSVAMNPAIIKSYAKKDLERSYSLLFNGMKYTFLLSFLLITPLIFEMEYIISLWLVNPPDYVVIFAQLTLVNLLIESFAPSIGASVQATGKIKWYQIVVGTMLFMNLPISYIAIKLTNSPISVMHVANLLAVLALVLRYIILHRLIKFPIRPLLKLWSFVVILILIVPTFILTVTNNYESNFGRFLLVLTISTGGCILLYYKLSATNTEKSIIKNRISVLVKKISNCNEKN
ncbi:MAG: lipopolysaccharide biosynthesis protein [Phocaeicola sp.]